MRFFRSTLTLLLICPAHVFSQGADSSYYFQIRDKQTQEALPFAQVTVYNADTLKWGRHADLDGSIRISDSLWKPGEIITVEVRYTGYQPLRIQNVQMKKGDTLIMNLSPAYTMFNAIEIYGYYVPLVDRFEEEPKTRKERKNYTPTPYIDSSAIYPDHVLARYDSIVNGTWFLAQKRTTGILSTHFYQSLQKAIQYPEHALKYGLQETIYFSLKIAGNGDVNEILLKKGTCPILVVTAAQVISKIARIVYDSPLGTYDNGLEKPEEIYILPVRFIIRN